MGNDHQEQVREMQSVKGHHRATRPVVAELLRRLKLVMVGDGFTLVSMSESQ